MLLITGGSGFLGSHVAGRIPGALALSSTDLDLTDGPAVIAALSDWKPEVVVHLAARVGGIIANTSQSADFVIDNMRIDGNILAALRVTRPRHVITLLSTCMYPNQLAPSQYPMTEDLVDAGPPPPWNAPYAAAKRALFYGTAALYEQYGIPFTSLIPANLYGPGDHFGRPGAHFLADAVDKIERSRRNRDPECEFFGTGVAMRQYVFAPDLAELIARIAESEPSNTAINVASQEHVSIRYLAEEIADVAGYEGRVVFTGVGPDGQYRKDVSPQKLLELVPAWAEMETDLREGLRQTIEWHRTHVPAPGTTTDGV